MIRESDLTPTTYFPYIQFRSTAWVKRAALFHDQLWRIIPANYHVTDPEDIRKLAESCDFLRNRWPSETEVENAAVRFASAYNTGRVDRVWIAKGGPAYVHMQKVSSHLIEFLAEHGLHFEQKRGEEWVAMPANAASAYMAFLANEFARHVGGPIASDERRMLDVVDLIQASDSAVEGQQRREKILLATFPALDLRDPARVPVEALVKFRQRYADQRKACLDAIERLAAEIPPGCSQRAMQAFVTEKVGRIASAVTELDSAAKGIGIATAIGTCSALCGQNLNDPVDAVAKVAIGGGVTLLLTSIWQLRKQSRSPMAYLYNLQRHADFASDRSRSAAAAKR